MNNLSIEAKAIYCYLKTFTGKNNECYPSVELLCKELDISPTRYYKHEKQLIDQGVIKKERQRNGSRWGKTIYKILK